ncbi:MAG TPA: amino acid racemase, partial [Caldimonas sp.]|nr:amino acid racemase [Caldimonas sp.]
AGLWDEATAVMIDAARRVEGAGAEALLICANTMHRMADDVAAAVSIPLIHVADATGRAIRAAHVRRPLLLATRYTMEQPFYVEHLARRGVVAIVPGAEDRAEVHRAIFDELCRGEVRPATCRRLRAIARRQLVRGAEGVVLGCTELSLALSQAELADVMVFDTTELHARAAVDFALDDAALVADLARGTSAALSRAA